MRRVPVNLLKGGETLAVELTVSSDNPDTQHLLRLGEGERLGPREFQQLKRVGVTHVFIKDPRTEDLNEIVYNEELDKSQQEILREMNSLSDNLPLNNGQNLDIEALREVLGNLTEVLKSSRLMSIFSLLKSRKDYTVQHSLEVAQLSLMFVMEHRSWFYDQLNRETSSTPPHWNRVLEDLGLGTLLHDIGKWLVPEEVLGKKGNLDEQEWKAVQKHPQLGREVLEEEDINLRAPARTPVIQHHEQYNGKGYPGKLEGKDIHLFGRLTTCCDVYSALTSPRPYQMELTPNRAHQTMLEMQEETFFDPDLLDKFLEYMPPFPVGQDVILSNGCRGVVSELGEDPRQPRVRVLSEGNRSLDDPYEITANTDSTPSIVN